MREPGRNTLLIGMVVALSALGLTVLIAPVITAYRWKRMAREKAIALLEERFDGVRLENLDFRLLPGAYVFPRVSAVGESLSLSLPGRATGEIPPFITVGKFEVELGLWGLMRHPMRIRRVRMDELTIQIPPKREDGSSGAMDEPPNFVVEDLIADGAMLRILPKKPGKDPLEFPLHQLRVASAGLGEPMRYDAVLENAKPPGEIQTKGQFGPLILRDAGATPLSGEYVFENADLSVFDGIAGTLRSQGTFGGVLERIEVEGTTETPDFQLKSAGNPIELRTDFNSVVDGTNGDTLLQPVEAGLGSSTLRTQGGVTKQAGVKGKTVCLNAEGSEGRVEDFLRLAMKSEKPFMVGGIDFRSLILIPPGKVDVVKKLLLDGEFLIKSAEFPERKVQAKVDKFSQIARGKNGDEAVSALREERVLSDMQGSFRLEQGVMYLTYLSFRVPGAEVRLEGTYGLVNEQIDFQGELRMEAKVSETTSGIKSFLLKLVDPLFEKKGAGAVIPIQIGGTPDDPSFGVDMKRIFRGEEVTTPRKFGKSIPSCSERVAESG